MRTIDADNLMEEIKSLRITITGSCMRDDEILKSIVQIIDEQPTVDTNRVSAHWEWNPDHCQYKCSHCGGEEPTCETPFCKWCGSKMDGGDIK